VIAGGGSAAALAACEVLRQGCAAFIVERQPTVTAAAIEAIAPTAIRAFADLALAGAFESAGAVVGSGFENAWEGLDRMRLMAGPWLHVERGALARALRHEAVLRGAKTITQARLPPLRPAGEAGQGFEWAIPGLPQRSDAAIDATGRAARWIGATDRRDAKVATLFRGPGSSRMRPGRIARIRAGWAYALFHPELTTVGVVETPPAQHNQTGLPPPVAAALDLDEPECFRLVQRRPAHAQWARAPIRGRLLAVGDAALACEPIAGQGIRFSLASATAAAAVIVNQRIDRSDDITCRYYSGMVASARDRHLARLDTMAGHDPPFPPEIGQDVKLVFSGDIVASGVRRGDQIVEELCLRLPDGGLVRWLGSFDLLTLRAIAVRPCSSATLAAALQAHGLDSPNTEQLLRWSLDREILRVCPS
jgi:hypothetical protein